MPGQPTSAGLVLQPSPRAHSFQVGSSWHTALENWSPNEFRFQPTRTYIQAQTEGKQQLASVEVVTIILGGLQIILYLTAEHLNLVVVTNVSSLLFLLSC